LTDMLIAAGPTDALTDTWVPIGALEMILLDTGVAAMVDGVQVAVFRLVDGRLFALGNHDPCSGANVLSRGILGDVDGVAVVASPVHKQRFELHTGRCLDADTSVPTFQVRVRNGLIEVRLRDDRSEFGHERGQPVS